MLYIITHRIQLSYLKWNRWHLILYLKWGKTEINDLGILLEKLAKEQQNSWADLNNANNLNFLKEISHILILVIYNNNYKEYSILVMKIQWVDGTDTIKGTFRDNSVDVQKDSWLTEENKTFKCDPKQILWTWV